MDMNCVITCLYKLNTPEQAILCCVSAVMSQVRAGFVSLRILSGERDFRLRAGQQTARDISGTAPYCVSLRK